MKQPKSIYLLLTILIFASLLGCSREQDVIELMAIEILEIYSTQTDQPNLFAISVLVQGTLADSCHSYHETEYVEPFSTEYIPTYSDGDTINVEITESIYQGPDDCLTAVYFYYDVIFLGFCRPGDYTLNVNGQTMKFQVQ